MEDYGTYGVQTHGKFKRSNRLSGESDHDKSNKSGQKNTRIRWNLSTKRRNSSRSSTKSRQDFTLKLFSKHSSKTSEHLKSRSLTESQFKKYSTEDGCKEPQSKQQKSNALTILQNRAEYEHDEREQNILNNKKISNLRYIINQTKELLLLTELSILQEDLKKLKTQIVEEQINVRRLKIGLRKREKQKKVLAQYYHESQTKVTIQRVKSERKTVHNYYQYYTTEVRQEFDKDRKVLLKARADSITKYIHNEKQRSKIKQQLLSEEIEMMKRQLEEYRSVTRKMSNCNSAKKQKVSTKNSLLKNAVETNLGFFNSIQMVESTQIQKKSCQQSPKSSYYYTFRKNEYMNFQ